MLEKIFRRTVVLCVLTRGGHCGVRISGFTSSGAEISCLIFISSFNTPARLNPASVTVQSMVNTDAVSIDRSKSFQTPPCLGPTIAL